VYYYVEYESSLSDTSSSSSSEEAISDVEWDEPLFEDSQLSLRLTAYLVINQLRRSNVPRTRMREWWDLICVLLPEGHALPTFAIAMKYLQRQDGCKLTEFHVCPNECVVFRNRDLHLDPGRTHQFADADVCPTCQHPRYRDPQRKKPYKKFSWFGFSDQLARRVWHPEWRDAVRLHDREVLSTIVDYNT
jgi:hypothetical protein